MVLASTDYDLAALEEQTGNIAHLQSMLRSLPVAMTVIKGFAS